MPVRMDRSSIVNPRALRIWRGVIIGTNDVVSRAHRSRQSLSTCQQILKPPLFIHDFALLVVPP